MLTSPLPTAVERSIHRFCEDLSSPRSLAVSMMLKYREWDQLVSLRVDPSQYQDPDAYWRDASVSSLLRKTEDLPTSFDRKAVAVENFWIGERDCARTNARLYPYVEDFRFPANTHVGGVHDFITRARKIVAEILGPCPDIVEGRFGPGATYGDRGQLITVPDKMSTRPTLTGDAWPWLFQWTGTLWAKACGNASSRRDPCFVRGNRFTTVPKDCTKHRGIAVEPSLNLFYQLGFGRVIRKRLLGAGVNLRDGQDIHRRLAREASIKGHLATLDLKNASDSVSRRLVELLLPKRWFETLDSLRSKTTLIDGKTVVLEKFSSMGNGFTFELETLIFLGLCLASNPQGIAGVNTFVYGDDIIVPTEVSKDVIAALKFFGLTVNLEKSFVDGWFRESCGGDYFMGADVRPHFLKESPNEPQQLFSLANGIWRLGLDDPAALSRHRYLRRFRLGIMDCLPSVLRRCRGPEGLGDIVLHTNEDLWQHRWRGSIRYIRVYRPARFKRVGWEHWKPDVILATACYGGTDERGGSSPPKGVTPRDAVLGYKLGWVPYS